MKEGHALSYLSYLESTPFRSRADLSKSHHNIMSDHERLYGLAAYSTSTTHSKLPSGRAVSLQQWPPSTRPSVVPEPKCSRMPSHSPTSYVIGHYATVAACKTIETWVIFLSKASQLVEDSYPDLWQECGHLNCVRRPGEAEDTARIRSLT